MRVLITGASRAIGRATAEVLSGRGHEVVATARDVSLLADLDVAQRLALDVRDTASIASALESAGDIDAVVNNAGLTGLGPLEDFPLDDMSRVFDVNTFGPLRMAQAVVPRWRERGSGVLVNISSVQGRIGTPLEGVYAASKHALEALSESMHFELGHFGIRIVIIQPGYIAPGMKHTDDHLGPAIYGDLHAQWNGTDTKLTGPGGRPGPELVGEAVADALEDPTTPLRVEVGRDAAMVLGLRRSMSDAEFEATMREALGLTW
ncbi:MAG TPA: SDR family oxidoreductase [Acidimicrobiales bacterium]|jgi:NAD(P)-dependent dehydrogenase (short-subunit alcohol dehydrogenase family)|nr:SDR family oxidoreductase [Acidimicrobiales bacterium]